MKKLIINGRKTDCINPNNIDEISIGMWYKTKNETLSW